MSEQLYHAVFQDAVDAMLILDEQRTIVEANRAAAALFGLEADALRGRSLDALVTDGDLLAAAWTELVALGETRREHRTVSAAGASRVVECSYRAHVHEGRHLCVARDITDRRRLEGRLAQSEKLESIGRLAGGVSHDYNNLLTAILGYVELILSHVGPNDPNRPDLLEIQKAGQRASGLTQQLLAFSRKQVLVPKDVDLNHTVSGLQTMLRRLIREDIALTCQLSKEPAVVMIDPTQMEQVILNLVLNARDAQPGGGEIRIEVARLPHSHPDVPPDARGGSDGWVRLRVIDRGTGLSPEARTHLFEPFFTTKELGKGTGLGLASVYGIVRQSSGAIAVESEPGRGTTFTMYFPAVAAPEAAETPPAPTDGPVRGRETILLVEDEDAVRVIVSAVLRRQGYQVLEASTARGAEQIFDQHARDIDLLLTDVVMPEVNGPALAQRLIARRADLRVLFISGYSDMAIPLDHGNPNVGFLSKPFQASVLTSRVREMLGRPALEDR